MTRSLMIFAALCGAIVSGCTTESRIESISPGTYALDCSGGGRSWDVCHELARSACNGRDFEIQSQVSNEGSGNVGSNDWSVAGSQITRTMVVRCR